MTLREIIDTVKGDGSDKDWPLMVMFAVSGALRSWEQGEPSTFEGDCQSILRWCEIYENVTPETVDQFIRECPDLLNIDIPERVLHDMVMADEEDGE